MTKDVSYLFADDGIPQRQYTQKAAKDGIITYSYSTKNFLHKEPGSSKRWTNAFTTDAPLPADAEQSRWIDNIFSHIDSVTGVSFQKVEKSRGEFHYNFVPTNIGKYLKDDLSGGEAVNNEWTGGLAFKNGYGQMYSFHNRKQYGGLDDIRDIQRTILESMGLTPPEGNANHPKHSWDNTLLSNNSGGRKSAGATFFMASDDKIAIRYLLGKKASSTRLPKIKIHSQNKKEELLIGIDGVKDIFKLSSKGMILKEDSGTQYNIIGPLINNYNTTYIGNFNPYEGDRIMIHRSLLNRKSPQHKKSKKLAKPFKKAKVKFEHILGDNYDKDRNVYYNDAGKLLIDTNGKRKGVISYTRGYNNAAGLNSQIVAFVDPIGPETNSFSGDWLSFFG